jgi:hypothetical protein
MDNYFFTPMSERQLQLWERRRRRRFITFFLSRGLIICCAVAFVDVLLWRSQGPAGWLLDGLIALIGSIPMSWLEWDSTEKRYRKTLIRPTDITGH